MTTITLKEVTLRVDIRWSTGMQRGKSFECQQIKIAIWKKPFLTESETIEAPERVIIPDQVLFSFSSDKYGRTEARAVFFRLIRLSVLPSLSELKEKRIWWFSDRSSSSLSAQSWSTLDLHLQSWTPIRKHFRFALRNSKHFKFSLVLHVKT